MLNSTCLCRGPRGYWTGVFWSSRMHTRLLDRKTWCVTWQNGP